MSRLFTIILSAILPLSLFSQNVEQEFKTKLQSHSGKNKTIKCDFSQCKKIKNIAHLVQSEGVFYYDNTGLMAMHYTMPKGDRIIMTGDSFVILMSGKRINANSKSNPMIAQISYMMQASMSGDISKMGRGWNMNIEKQGNGYNVILKPTDRLILKYITSMTMNFRESDLTLEDLRIDETSGGYTQYTFKNKVINGQIDSSYFVAE